MINPMASCYKNLVRVASVEGFPTPLRLEGHSSAIFSDLGNEVYCVDVNTEKIEGLKKGKIPFYEPGLKEYVERNTKAKRLFFTTSYGQSVPKSQIVIICVGTPPKNNGEADLSYLFSAV